jgi:hypothetical protein
MVKRAILVVGTGRSGTSAMTGVLQILGASLGKDLKFGDAFNAKGYFENTQLTELNKQILFEVGVPWYGLPFDPKRVQPIPVTPTRVEVIRERISQVFGEDTLITIKDPRFCLLLETYVSALRAMKYEMHCVRMLRDSAAVAKSLAAIADIDEALWLPLVDHHATLLDGALKRTATDCVDCKFDDLVERARETIFKLLEQLPFLTHSVALLPEAISSVDVTLRHH